MAKERQITKTCGTRVCTYGDACACHRDPRAPMQRLGNGYWRGQLEYVVDGIRFYSIQYIGEHVSSTSRWIVPGTYEEFEPRPYDYERDHRYHEGDLAKMYKGK